MIPTENLYLKYLYSRSGTARREFLDALGREETDALVVDLHNRPVADDGDSAAADPLAAVLKKGE